jgi:tRNA threonylcarbamoyladenosine biosynthesis protein TsaB
MSAKTFAYALGCRLLAIETFAALAAQAPAEVAAVEVIADAQQDKVYHQSFARASDAAKWEPQSPLQIRRLEDWLAQRNAEGWVSGPGLRVYRDRLPPDCRIVAQEFWEPQPESLLRLGLPRFLAGENDNLWSLEPLYLRPSAAEEKLRDKPGERGAEVL